MTFTKIKIAVATMLMAVLAAGAGWEVTRLTAAVVQPTPPTTQELKAIALAWAAAVRVGDVQAARKLAVGREENLTVQDDMIEWANGLNRLNQAANERFGPSTRPLINVSVLDDFASRLEGATATISGDSAELRSGIPDAKTPFALRRFQGQWRVDADVMTKSDPAKPGKVAAAMRTAIDDVRKEIISGKYATRGDAGMALMRALNAADQKIPAATRPTTQP
jgi:hypothetical protein